MKADTMTKEALQNQKYHNSQKKMTPTPLFEEPLKFIAHGHIFERFQQLCYQCVCIWSMYTVKDLFGNQVFLEKSQTYDVCFGSVLPVLCTMSVEFVCMNLVYVHS